ncbi:Uu.00g069700.m01.CDS01 [Anthostomella pinea]|uniref:Uu.00g069700.m01.CDS01 n=1 Tax=Anthostomella pinea TaxID=933095 RepID=A0AAI8YNM6_9PEZI|nr:Uu.00g069700.m01.CDS01 [Anthostomella pinea]
MSDIYFRTAQALRTVTFPLLLQYRQNQGLEIDQGYDTLDKNFGFPLFFDPGTDWAYGPGLDWSARLILRASGMPTEEFMQKNLAGPLGINTDDMTFELQKHPNTQARRGDMTFRVDAKDGTAASLEYRDEEYWHKDNEPHGGQGIYTTPVAYKKNPEARTCDLLFEPALTPLAEKDLNDYCQKFRDWVPGSPIPVEVKKSHSVGGLLTLEDCDGDRWHRKGNSSWGGLPNIIWNVDREAGICSL